MLITLTIFFFSGKIYIIIALFLYFLYNSCSAFKIDKLDKKINNSKIEGIAGGNYIITFFKSFFNKKKLLNIFLSIINIVAIINIVFSIVIYSKEVKM